MLRVGLTGGIASGKTTVARLLVQCGIPVIDSDQIAHDLVVPGSDALSAIVEAFGPEVVAPDGTMDRSRVGRMIFEDASKRRRLEEILHPRIHAEQDCWLSEMESKGDVPLAVVDAALMIESGGWKRFDLVVVVDCDEAQQVERLHDQRGLDREAARARIRAQMSLSEKVKYADRIIDNRGAIEELELQVCDLAKWLRGKASEKETERVDK